MGRKDRANDEDHRKGKGKGLNYGERFETLWTG
jgi:hypothetical protein